jgi:hypothetical protein
MLNVDRRGRAADVHMDAADLALADRCVGRMQAYHLVEHLGWVGCTHAFCEWFRVMRPGAELVVEAPDLLESARRFAAAGFEERAVLANWLYGKESPGMHHLFGFEHAVLENLLRACGFVRVRSEEPRTHAGLPGLRLSARRGRRASQEAHAAFKRLLRRRGLVPVDQDLAVELHEQVAADLVRTLSRTGRTPPACHALMARLVVHDPEVGRAALDASAPLLPGGVVRAWRRIMDEAGTALIPRLLTSALVARGPSPGRMQRSYDELRDAARAHLRDRARGREPRTPLPTGPDARLAVRPFSEQGLGVEARRRSGLGLRHFVRGDLDVAAHHLALAAAFNSNAPSTFWNLSRLALARGRRDEALHGLDEALRAARLTGSELVGVLEEERRALAGGGHVPVAPVSAIEPLAREV